MKYKDLNFYGETAVKYDLLVNEYKLFKRYYDVFIYSAILGFSKGVYISAKPDSGDKNITIKQQIFINNPECEDVFNAIAVNHLSERESSDYLKRLIDADYTQDDNNIKFEIVKNYSLSGINVLYDSIVGSETDRGVIFGNFVDFFADESNFSLVKDEIAEEIDAYI